MKKCGVDVMLPGGAPTTQVMVGLDSSVTEMFIASCAMSEDFEDPMTCVAESFPDISSLRPLALALKESLRGARNSKKDKLCRPGFGLHCVPEKSAQQIAAQRAGSTRRLRSLRFQKCRARALNNLME